MKPMRLFSSILFLMVIVGCVGQPRHPTGMFTTKITSEPPGARIEVDNDYLGDAPLDVTWEGYLENGIFRSEHIVRALPRESGQQVQVKSFRGTRPMVHWGDKIPKHIFFDMNLVIPATKQELEIKHDIDIK